MGEEVIKSFIKICSLKSNHNIKLQILILDYKFGVMVSRISLNHENLPPEVRNITDGRMEREGNEHCL